MNISMFYGLTILNLGRSAPLTVEYPASASEIIILQILQFIYHSDITIIIQTEIFLTSKYIILSTYFACFFLVRGQHMYMNTLLHCHFCIQIITDHFLLSKVSRPIHTIPGMNAYLLYPILCPGKYSIRHKLLYCPVCIFGCLHGNQCCVASYHYFYTLGGGGPTGRGHHQYSETIWRTPDFYLLSLSFIILQLALI